MESEDADEGTASQLPGLELAFVCEESVGCRYGGRQPPHLSSVVVDIRGGRDMFCAEGILGLLLEILLLVKSVN